MTRDGHGQGPQVERTDQRTHPSADRRRAPQAVVQVVHILNAVSGVDRYTAAVRVSSVGLRTGRAYISAEVIFMIPTAMACSFSSAMIAYAEAGSVC